MAKTVAAGFPFTFTSTESEVDETAATVGAVGAAARVYLLAVLPKPVSTFSPLRALTWKVYCWFTLNPVTVLVPQVASGCHAAEPPSEPSVCT